jgi:hypothetical protein
MTALRRIASVLALAVVAALLFSPTAVAADGVGLWGRANDKVVTLFGFAIMGFFTILVIMLSLVQTRLENRKERIQEDLDRLRR